MRCKILSAEIVREGDALRAQRVELLAPFLDELVLFFHG
jgi:hypothetical protein